MSSKPPEIKSSDQSEFILDIKKAINRIQDDIVDIACELSEGKKKEADSNTELHSKADKDVISDAQNNPSEVCNDRMSQSETIHTIAVDIHQNDLDESFTTVDEFVPEATEISGNQNSLNLQDLTNQLL